MIKKVPLALFGLCTAVPLSAQCSLALASDSLEACVGDTIFLSASGSNSYQWSHDATLSCDTCASPPAPEIICWSMVRQTMITDRIKTTIYSRWGTKVFESSVLGEYWDGRFEGRPVAPGVYFLTVEVANPYVTSPITASATVHLLR